MHITELCHNRLQNYDVVEYFEIQNEQNQDTTGRSAGSTIDQLKLAFK